MSKHLSASQTVELLQQLRAIVEDFASREEKLNRDFRVRIEGMENRFADHRSDLENRLSQQLAEEETRSQAARDLLNSRHERRKSWISKAYGASKRQGAQRIDHEEGRRKYHVQKGQLAARRTREESLTANDSRFADFNRQLSETRDGFLDLERRAQKSFRGYRSLRKRLQRAEGSPDVDASGDQHRLLEQLGELRQKTETELGRFDRLILPKFFRFIPLWAWTGLVLTGAGVAIPLLKRRGVQSITDAQIALGAGLLVALVIMAFYLGKRAGRGLGVSIAHHLESARRLHDACLEKAKDRHAGEIERIEAEAKSQEATLEREWRSALEDAALAREVLPQTVDKKGRRATSRHGALHETASERLEGGHAQETGRLRTTRESAVQELTAAHESGIGKFQAEHREQWQKLELEWRTAIVPPSEQIVSISALAQQDFPAWNQRAFEDWAPPASFKNAAPFARLEVDLKRFLDNVPKDGRLLFPGGSVFSLPLLLKYPEQGSVLFETTRSGNEEVIQALNNIIFRLLATSPVGKLSFTIIDPVKLGQNFATIMHLADYEENLLNGKIWTQASQIEERLGELNEHMEKVIQMYLRNEYETIADYNLEAGNIAEKYHVVVISDFPANFTETSVRRLLRIAASGARCGVYTLIHWDHRQAAPPNLLAEELRQSSVCLNADQWSLTHPNLPNVGVTPDDPPAPDFATQFLQHVGEISRGSNRVEVPFTQVAPREEEMWSLETTDELRVPMGRSGASKLQYLAMGRGTRQHALVAGKTGSGKSTLFHVIITNLALWCSPEQVEFYLVDFKKGVEFKAYATARLPHARVVAIESDREFGLSVLQRLDEELKGRGDLYRKLGVQDVAGYKKAGGTEAIPRTLLIIDEFQEFFVEDDRISQAAAVLLDRIVRQGRAFGIHVLLGSQTLGGAYTLARTTIGQMVIRIALQCNEADAYLIMDENNPAPRLLSRPGEGIYNDMAGAIEGNSPFQAVWLSDEERGAYLTRIRALAELKRFPGPIVFEGNAPSDVRENAPLQSLLEAPLAQPGTSARVWLGAPNSIKGPTAAVFQKRSGSNLLLVGQREEAVLAMIVVSLVSLAAHYPPGTTRFVIFDSTPPGSAERANLEETTRILPQEVLLGRTGDLAEIIHQLAEDLKTRSAHEQQSQPVIFLFLHGLQNFKKFRQDDDFSLSAATSDTSDPAAELRILISEGPAHGIHVIATLDTYNNVNRFLGRKGLSEFEMRVLFQMSTNDSASLCDDPKASMLGLHRALFYNEQEGYLETFRPYALPSQEWIQEAGRQLDRARA